MKRGISQRIGVVLAVLAACLGSACGSRSALESGKPIATDGGVPDGAAPCVDVPLNGKPITLALDTRTELLAADVVLLVDVTASMREEIAQIQSKLAKDIVPAIRAEIPDTQVGVASLADFPVEPYGAPRDVPFELHSPVTGDLRDIQRAVDSLPERNGLDDPEADVESLYQLATGEGLGNYIPAAAPCANDGVGYPCFRPGAQHIVLLFTDEVFHNGAEGEHTYAGALRPEPHTYAQMLEAATTVGLRVVGFDSGDGVAAPDLRRVAMDTGALDGEGGPLVYDIGKDGKRLDTSVVDAIKTYAQTARFDVRAVVHDLDPDDGVDAAAFVRTVTPIRADPMDDVTRIDADDGVIYGVTAGTRLFYSLTLRKGSTVPGVHPRRFAIGITFVDGSGGHIGERTVDVVIPGADGVGCAAL